VRFPWDVSHKASDFLARSSGGYSVNVLIRTSPTTLSRAAFSAQTIGVGAQDMELVLILGLRFDL
jgi:hypothetical protein